MAVCTVEPCASARAYEIKFGNTIDIAKIRQVLGDAVLSFTPVVLLCKINGKPVSIYASGRAMIKEVDKKQAEEIGNELIKKLEGTYED